MDRRAKRQSLGLKPDGSLIATIGRSTEQKGFGYFIEAGERLTRTRPDCQFVLMGTGELLPEMEALASDLVLTQNLHFLGTRTDVEQILAVTDVLVSSSLWEGLSTVILEAMAAGVPVVATRVSGSAELVKDGQTGLLVPSADPEALAQAVSSLLADPVRADSLSRAARVHSRQVSIDAVASQYQQLYFDLWKKRLLRYPGRISGPGELCSFLVGHNAITQLITHEYSA